MKKLLFGILALSICATACKKDKDETPSDLDKAQVVATWKISSDPAVNINIVGGGEMKNKIVDTLEYLFKKDDVYLFKDDNKVEVTRNGNKAPFPNQYSLDKQYLVFDGFIKVAGAVNGNTFKLVAGNDEIRFTVKTMILAKKDAYYTYFSTLGVTTPDDLTEAFLDEAMIAVTGSLEITLTKQ
ncbi:MAG: hypothetical protein LBD59_11905 [Prevotellaceae bacterium]|jgi:hypothetical protein|nr:hypothetical protein [Prevotellaceae bacterium]